MLGTSKKVILNEISLDNSIRKRQLKQTKMLCIQFSYLLIGIVVSIVFKKTNTSSLNLREHIYKIFCSMCTIWPLITILVSMTSINLVQ